MEASALESAIRALEIRSESLESWLKLWITLVVVGVAIELVIVLKEYFDDLEECRRGTIRSPAKPSRWKLIFSLLGAGLVAIGVAGELGIDFKAGDVETGLRNRN